MYPSNLNDKEWQVIQHLFVDGNRAKHKKQDLVNGVFYLIKTGCQWRQLPKDFPPYSTVHSFYRRSKLNGTWEKMMDFLVKECRKKSGKDPVPTYGVIDSQSTKTTGAAEERGFDGGKKIKGRKRHIVTDTQGNMLKVTVHAANIHDTVTGCSVFKDACEKYPSLKGVCADAGYRKTMGNYVKNILNKTIDISKKIVPDWTIQPTRWVVERTFGWLNGCRRLSKDYEITSASAENYIMIAHSMVLLSRLIMS